MVDLTKFSEVGMIGKELLDANWTAIENALNALKELSTRDRATVAQILDWSGDAGLTAERIRSAMEWASPVSTANLTINWAASQYNLQWQLPGNGVLENPTNVNAMSIRNVYLYGSDSTPRTVIFGSYFKGDLPTIADATSTKGYLLTILPISATHLVVSSMRAL